MVRTRPSLIASGALIAAASLVVLTAGCGSNSSGAPLLNVFHRTNFTSDQAGFTDSAGAAAKTDANLKNPWGIAFTQTGFVWISDNGTGKLTVYDATGTPQPVVVSVPVPGGGGTGAPTGQVANATAAFGAANFIACTEDGTIVAWNSGTTAQIKVDRSGASPSAVYKGLAIGSTSAGSFLYAANFRAGTVDVFDTNFAPVQMPGGFTDLSLPAGYAPFNIANINGSLFVAYAIQNAAKHDDVGGPGNGILDVYDTSGHLLRRLATGTGAGGSVSQLNSPWGLALAPSGFGKFPGALLVGNFGDGRITALDSNTGAVLGQLQDSGGNPISVSGLWGIAFPPLASGAQATTLYFTAGTNGEADGLFGAIQPGP